MITKVLCTAPLTSALVDTNKGVRPCCTFEGKYIGNLKNESLINIINSSEWKKLKEQMYNHQWPKPCLSCKEREAKTGWSVRKLYTDGTFDVTGWDEEKLTYLEFNGSNICNLACLHCSAGFSSRWVIDNKKAKKVFLTYDKDKQQRMSFMDPVSRGPYDNSKYRTLEMHLPNPDLILENLKQLNLTYLRTINLKGGEPLLNSETLTILNYLDGIDILQNIRIVLSSNGTFINQEILDAFKKCKSVTFNLSMDGIGELFNYIRYGDAKFEDLEPVIAKLNELPNINIDLQCSVMNYNIFNLLEMRQWVIELSKKYNKVKRHLGFTNCVQYPRFLGLQTLSDNTRQELYNYYNQLPYADEFSSVLHTLQQEYSGDAIHNNWVEYTEMMETVRGNNIRNIVPRMASELVFK